jgi:hypothetical protein
MFLMFLYVFGWLFEEPPKTSQKDWSRSMTKLNVMTTAEVTRYRTNVYGQ